ncbi:MAG: PBP1A family penicillin-binding protein [Candidatus Binatia bacterium]|nr:PBP1A family penicillin-binding protein [Candidatus Binatia bacterium]
MRRWRVKLGLWLLVCLGLGLFWLDRTVQTGFGVEHWRDPVRFYAAPQTISIGVAIEEAGILGEIAALDYREVKGEPVEPGTFRRTDDDLEIHLRPAPVSDAFGDRSPRRARLVLEEGRVLDIVDERDGRVAAIELEPRPLDGLYDAHWTGRRRMRLQDVPPVVVAAVLAAEDARFSHHFGLDFSSLLRAARENWRAGEVKQGGSTITQQLIKNHFLSQERTIWRKMREIPLALALERRYSKDEILEAYLASVYLGHDRLVGVHGLAEGAWVFFGKSVSDLTVGEGATMAGIIRAPNIYSPLRHPERALVRRNQVLSTMEALRWITPQEAAAARAEKGGLPQTRRAASEAYFVQHAVGELEDAGFAPAELSAGSDVFTTLDARLQDIVAEEVERASREIGGAQLAVVALDPLTGSLRALVGGRDYLESQYDRASRMRRPVGSMFKPFVALAAVADPESGVTPATRLLDAPIKVGSGRTEWVPRNHDGRFRGEVTLRETLADSLNVPTVRLAQQVGIERLAAFGERVGVSSRPLPRLPSIALGAFESSLLDVASAYTVFPGGGIRVEPFAIDSVKAPSGVVLYDVEPVETPMAEAAPTYVVHTMLEGVVDDGTAARLRASGLRGAFAGKTGTSTDQRDAWFVGYTPSLVLGVWVGFDDDRSLPGGGSKLAVPLWGAIARRAFAGAPPEPFRRPGEVEVVELDEATGLRASPECGPSVSEVFVAGTAPAESCRKWTAGNGQLSS